MITVLKNTLKNIRRGPFQAIAAIMVLFLTFFVAQAFAVLTYSSQVVMGYFETKPQITAFFDDEVGEERIITLREEISQLEYVDQVTYISKEDALEIYREQNIDDPLLLEMVTADILPASLEVSAISIEYLPLVNEYFEALDGVEEISYQQDVVSALQRWTRGLRMAGSGVVIFLGVTSMLVLILIISMKVSGKRYEISIMRLLGASSWYIRGPFLFEGLLYGVLSATLAWLAVYGTIEYLSPYLMLFLGDIPLLPLDINILLTILAGAAGAGGLMGMISSFIATRRYYR